MARLQILELPEGNSDNRPPFVLVIDQAGEDSLFITDGPDIWPGFKNDTGCQHVIVTTETIDIPANDTSGYLRDDMRNDVTVHLGDQPIAWSQADETQARTVEALKSRRDWCCSLAYQTLGKQHIDDCRQAQADA